MRIATAAQISSVATKDERKHAVEDIEKLKLLYVTPELVATENFRQVLRKLEVSASDASDSPVCFAPLS